MDAIESALLENEKVQNIRPLPTVSEGSCEAVPLVSDEEFGMDSLDEAVQVKTSPNCSGEVKLVADCDEVCNKLSLDNLSRGDDKAKLVEETQQDNSLKYCRKLASKNERGYRWEDGLLIHVMVDDVAGELKRIVIPKCRRGIVMKLVHNGCGHIGYRKALDIIGKRFVWPNVSVDVHKYCQSCIVCQKSSKRGQQKVPMMERPIITEPFEVIAVDIVGPLPPGKGKVVYILTTICMATRWTDVAPFKSITAKSVADALVGIFSRTGLPLRLLSDNGTQFTSKLIKELSTLFGIELVKTTPYHPQSNGVIERMHATLESMLRKAHAQGLDWVGQIPFALFALRQMPCRSTGFSPYELIYGKNMRTPLDLLYSGWKLREFQQIDTSDWVMQLAEKLEILRDVAMSNSISESKKRKYYYDCGKVERKLLVGQLVWCKIPGRNGKLEDSWDGPYKVEKILSAVNYRIREVEGKHRSKSAHVNSLKKFVDRNVDVNAMTVIADDMELDESNVVLHDEVAESERKEIEKVLCEFEDVFDGSVGCYLGGKAKIVIEPDAKPKSHKPYRIPVALKQKVEEAVTHLVDEGWVEEAESLWGAPIVPVPKPDGSIRLCMDYRSLNSATPQLQYQIPLLEEMLVKVGSASILSKIDLQKEYYQIPLEDDSKDVTAFVTPWGCFRFNVLPFGLRNAPAIFQAIMVKF